jgi:hypothetical protein
MGLGADSVGWAKARSAVPTWSIVTAEPRGLRYAQPTLRLLISPLLPFVIGVFLDFETSQIAWSRGIVIESEATTEGCLSQSSCSIKIFNGADQVQSPISPQDVTNLLVVKNTSVANWTRQCNAAPQGRVCSETSYPHFGTERHFIIWRSLRETVASWKKNGLIIDPRNEPFRVADVDNIKIDLQGAPQSPSGIIHQPHMFKTHSWSMRGKEFASSETNGFMSGAKYSTRRPPKSTSETSSRYCGASDEPIMADCSEYAGPRYNKEYVERGALVVLGVIIAIGFCIHNAGRDGTY